MYVIKNIIQNCNNRSIKGLPNLNLFIADASNNLIYLVQQLACIFAFKYYVLSCMPRWHLFRIYVGD